MNSLLLTLTVRRSKLLCGLLVGGALFGSTIAAHAQAVAPAGTPPPAATGTQPASTAPKPAPTAEEEEEIILPVFEISADSDLGYEAAETLAGGRTRTQLKDVGSQVLIMNEQFMQDMSITDLNDAIRFSLHMETSADAFDVSAENLAGNEISIQAFAGSPRSRGLTGTTIGRDFFQTYIPVDTYNVERLTFAPGANNMLFGNSTPAGSIGSSTKRALPTKRKFSLQSRLDSHGSLRTVVDANVPVVKNKFALRYVGLRDRTESFREPSFRDQDRHYLTGMLAPWRWLSVRGWYETYDSHAQPMRNTLLRDRVTPWIDAGRPGFDNRTVANGGRFPPSPTITPASPFFRTPTARTNPYYLMDHTGGLGLTRIVNTVQTVGHLRLDPAPNNFDWSVTNPDLIPLEANIIGNGIQNMQEGRNYGIVLNISPVRNLWIEVGKSREYFQHRFVDLFRGSEAILYADANLYATDAAGLATNTPNPNFGRFYIEDVITFAGTTIGTYDQSRVSAAYQLDFTQNKSWLKHLGRYNISAFVDQLFQRQSGAGQRFDPILTTPFPGGAAGTASAVFFRYYLPQQSEVGVNGMTVNLPFDPLAEGNIPLPNTNGYSVRGYKSPMGAGGVSVPGKRRANSKAFSVQGLLWDDRIVLNYSRRTDEILSYSLTGVTIPRLESGGFAWLDDVWDYPQSGNYTRGVPGSKTRENSGIVLHPLRWLSFHYQKLGNGQVTGLSRVNLDGSDIPLSNGSGDEMGFSVRLFRNRVTIKANKYTTRLEGIQGSPLGLVNAVPAAAEGGGNSIRDDLPSLEQAALHAGAPVIDRFREWQELLLAQPWYPESPGNVASDPTTSRDRYDFIVDRESKGYDVTVTANPSRGWRISLGANRNIATESNLAPQYFELINERLPVWAQYLDAPTWRNGQTLGELLQPAIANFYFIEKSAGKPNAMDRKYRVTASLGYDFNEGVLRGARVGANYIWRSAAAVGFQPLEVSDNPYVVPGLTSPTITIQDIQNPIRGSAITTFDVFMGYRRRLLKGKVSWDMQLNVRNILDRTDLIVQKASTDGIGRVFTLQEPRTFILTNTFSF